MLGILLTILKIILWIILGILGLILLLVLLVLFSPIRYKVDLNYNEKAHVVATIKYLVVKVKVVYDQRTKDMQQVIRVFGFRLGKGKNKKSKDKSDDELFIDGTETMEFEDDFEPLEVKDDQKTDALMIQADNSDSVDETVPDSIETETDSVEEAQAQDSESEESEMVDPMYDLWDEEFQENLSDGEKRFFGRVIALIKKVIGFLSKFSPSNIIDKIQTKKAKIDKKVNRIKKFWNLSCTVKTREYLKKYLKSMFKHILPRKVRGYVHYGFDEPYKTGQITGYLSLMPFMYQKHLSVQPDFYNKVIEADLHLKGKIRLGYLARIVLNINIWRTLKALKRVTK